MTLLTFVPFPHVHPSRSVGTMHRSPKPSLLFLTFTSSHSTLISDVLSNKETSKYCFSMLSSVRGFGAVSWLHALRPSFVCLSYVSSPLALLGPGNPLVKSLMTNSIKITRSEVFSPLFPVSSPLGWEKAMGQVRLIYAPPSSYVYLAVGWTSS